MFSGKYLTPAAYRVLMAVLGSPLLVYSRFSEHAEEDTDACKKGKRLGVMNHIQKIPPPEVWQSFYEAAGHSNHRETAIYYMQAASGNDLWFVVARMIRAGEDTAGINVVFPKLQTGEIIDEIMSHACARFSRDTATSSPLSWLIDCVDGNGRIRRNIRKALAELQPHYLSSDGEKTEPDAQAAKIVSISA